MSRFRFLSLSLVALSITGIAQAGVYTVTGVHNCCGACNKKITEALSGVEGVADVASKPNEESLSFSAPDDKTAQKAINALGQAGFHGKVDGGKKVAFRDNSKVEAGKVQKLELVGVHNCCPGCSNSIKDLLTSVDGVKTHTIPDKGTSVIVEGDFDGQAVVKALNEGGFHVRLKGAGKEKKPN